MHSDQSLSKPPSKVMASMQSNTQICITVWKRKKKKSFRENPDVFFLPSFVFSCGEMSLLTQGSREAERKRGSAPEDRGVWVCVLGLTRRAEPRMRTQPDAADRAAFGPAPSVYREGGTAAVTKARREEEEKKNLQLGTQRCAVCEKLPASAHPKGSASVTRGC